MSLEHPKDNSSLSCLEKKKKEIVLKKLYNATEAMGGKGQKA